MARTLMDLSKVQAAAAFATTFFKDSPIPVRLLMVAVFAGLLIVGFIIEPAERREKGDKDDA